MTKKWKEKRQSSRTKLTTKIETPQICGRFSTGSQFKRGICLLAILLLSWFQAGCSKQNPAAQAGAPRQEDMSSGPVGLIIKADPAIVDLKQNMLLSLIVTCPRGVEVDLPPLDDRLSGFRVTDSFSSELPAPDGQKSFRRTFNLTPVIADEYRLAPIPVIYRDTRKATAGKDWFATSPIVFETTFKNMKAGKDIKDSFEPVWIFPSSVTIALYALAVVIAVALALLLWKLSRRVQRQIRLMRMSPRERALEELAELLKKELIQKNMVKEFYIELTMVVRRFIERLYRIRAPEQTTEEFLLSVSRHPRFSREIVLKLKAFLEAADLVKFAAVKPEPLTIDKAVNTAKEYVEVDTGPDAGISQESVENN